LVQEVELTIEPRQRLVQLLAQSTAGQPAAVAFGGAHLDQLLAARDQFAEGPSVRTW
jgi:hypothetical protein